VSLLPLTGLADPSFAERDPQKVVDELVAQFEMMTGRTLYPAQVERLVIDLVAYRESLTREAIQDAGKQSLVSFARAPFLDYLGEFLGCRRLPGSQARTLLRFAFNAPLASTVLIPVGTRVQDAGGVITFAVAADTTAPAGAESLEVWGLAVEAGTAANGLTAGQLAVLIDPLSVPATVANASTSYGGTEAEQNERFRDRVRLAAERPACGSLAAYRYHAMTARSDLVDVGVTSDQPGQVRVSALAADGIVDAGLLDVLRAQLNRADVRPLTDQVIVVAAERVGFSIAARLWMLSGASAVDAQAQARQRLQDWAGQQRRRLGRDLVPAQLVQLLQSVQGVYRVEIDSPGLRELSEHQWADCEGVDVVIAGVANG
jgi:phage-related baseplate assembly protein